MPAATSTLSDIRMKVRRLTRSPSASQITDDQIDQYVNTFIIYDMPSQLRLFSLRQNFTFWTIPNVDTYSTNTTYVNNPLYNFQNKYMTVHEPFYIGGFRAYFTQSQDEFFGLWPLINLQQQIGVGNGVTTVYSATSATTVLQPPVIQNNVTFSAIDASNGALTLHDVPVVDAAGNATMNGNLYVPGFEPKDANGNIIPPTVVDATNTINYLTGAYTVTFKNDQNVITPPSGVPSVPTGGPAQNAIWCQAIPYTASIPTSVLFYNNSFTLRPVPDISYPVEMEVYTLPSQLLASGQSPQLQQWWQYIAVWAAKKIFEDRMDMESVNLIMPLAKEQEQFVLRTTLVQESNERSATIYMQQSSIYGNTGGWPYAGGAL